MLSRPVLPPDWKKTLSCSLQFCLPGSAPSPITNCQLSTHLLWVVARLWFAESRLTSDPLPRHLLPTSQPPSTVPHLTFHLTFLVPGCWGRDRLCGEMLSIILNLRLITPSLRQCLWDAEFSSSAGFRLDRSSLWRSLPCSHSSAIRQTIKTTTENLLLTQIKN